jgi:hypothetical protein
LYLGFRKSVFIHNRMGERRVHAGFCWEDQREGDHLGDPGIDGRIILKWIKKWDGAWTG